MPLKEQCHTIFASGFFHKPSSPKPLKLTIGSFRLFSKIRGDIRKTRCTFGINNTGRQLKVAKLPPVSTGKLIHEKPEVKIS
jgi:hypothetical protein